MVRPILIISTHGMNFFTLPTCDALRLQLLHTSSEYINYNLLTYHLYNKIPTWLHLILVTNRTLTFNVSLNFPVNSHPSVSPPSNRWLSFNLTSPSVLHQSPPILQQSKQGSHRNSSQV